MTMMRSVSFCSCNWKFPSDFSTLDLRVVICFYVGIYVCVLYVQMSIEAMVLPNMFSV